MAWRVLVPVETRGLFAQHQLPGVAPVFYGLRDESFCGKALRKVGWRDARQALLSRLDTEESGRAEADVLAIWLLPTGYIPRAQMVCLLERYPTVRWVYLQMTGTDHLELECFRRRGIMVSNAGRLNSRMVAEMAVASILAQAKRLPEHLALQRTFRWRSLACAPLGEQTVGVIGTGNIGFEVAGLCRAIGMRVLGASRDPGRFGDDPSPYHRVLKLDGEVETLLAESDHVVLALPLTPETRGLLEARLLKHMKHGATLVNVARGALVQEGDLCRALARGAIGAAYVDVPSRVPTPVWSRLYWTPNLVLTHYSAANGPGKLVGGFDQFITGLSKVLQGSEPPDRVA